MSEQHERLFCGGPALYKTPDIINNRPMNPAQIVRILGFTHTKMVDIS